MFWNYVAFTILCLITSIAFIGTICIKFKLSMRIVIQVIVAISLIAMAISLVLSL